MIIKAILYALIYRLYNVEIGLHWANRFKRAFTPKSVSALLNIQKIKQIIICIDGCYDSNILFFVAII